MAFVSLIIPIYKVEKYLRQCIDSVIRQNIDDIEIILVDDGSPDDCPKICDEYAEKDKRIKVIHKTNGGSSSARNAGIDLAIGEYLMFMDSDDWWNSETDINSLFEQVKSNPETEMFLLTSLDYIEGQGYFKRKEHNNLSKIRTDTVVNYYSDLLQNGNLEVHAATKIFKTQFIKSNDLYFKVGIKGEDNEWMIRVLRLLQSVKIINEPLYIYRASRVGSITNCIQKQNITDLLNIVSNSLSYCKSNDFNVKRLELCFDAYLWFVALGLTCYLSKKEFIEVRYLFKSTSEVCKFSNSKKTNMCYRIYKLFGLKITANILSRYIKCKNKKNLNKVKVQ